MRHGPISRSCLAVLGAFVLFVLTPPVSADFNDNLGFKWMSETTSDLKVALDPSIPAVKNTLYTFPGTTTTAIPVLISGNFNTLDPIDIHFLPATNPDPKSPDPVGRFMISMDISNATSVNWIGFRISVTDDNGVDYYSQQTGFGGSLLHPDRTHMHVDKIQPSSLYFRDIVLDQTYYNSKGVLTTTHPAISDTDQGIYQITMTDASRVIEPNQTYRPLFYDADPTVSSLLDIHLKRDSAEAMREAKFTLTLQPITAPEPSTLLISLFGAPVLLAALRRTGRRPRSA
jgi:hypothetical protein